LQLAMIKISIIILSKNAGAGFVDTLTAVYSQLDVPSFEVIILDSGSTDGTLDVCAKFPAKVIQIPPTEFHHGRTRNYGASLAEGDYIVFLVQDATPAGPDWLKNLVAPVESNDKIAGAYSRNMPRPDASMRQAMEIEQYFQPNQQLQTSPADHTFSNVSSVVRKRVFDQIPFPTVGFGEDQLWAKQVLEAGYFIQYAASSVVVHSHHDDLDGAFQRGYQEGCHAKTIGHPGWHSSSAVIIMEMLWELFRWAIRKDMKSCRYSITMAAWHLGFRKGYAAKR